MRLPRLDRRPRPAPRHAAGVVTEGRPADHTATIGVMLVLILTSGFVVGTTAMFNSTINNKDSTFATAILSKPSSPSASVSGTTVTLDWNPFDATSDNAGAGIRIGRKAKLPSPDGNKPGCAEGEGGFTTFRSTNVVGGPITDSTTHGAFAAGNYICYEMSTVYPCNLPSSTEATCDEGTNPWTSISPNRVVDTMQIGHVLQSWTFTRTSGSADQKPTPTNDRLVLNFNQYVDTSTVPSSGLYMCFDHPNDIIYVGDTDATSHNAAYNGACATTEVTIGTLRPAMHTNGVGPFASPYAGQAFGISGRTRRYNMSTAWTNCLEPGKCKTLNAVVGTLLGGGPAANVPSLGINNDVYQFTPTAVAGRLVSAFDALPICSATPVGGWCQPVSLLAW